MRFLGGRIFAAIYGWLCERLYYELAEIYDPVSALVSLGRWDVWRDVAFDLVEAEATDGETILELGFGTGVLLHKLRKPRRTVIGVDRSPAMTAVALRRMSVRSDGLVDFSASELVEHKQNCVDMITGDAEQLPLTDHCVDTIVSTFPAPYILQPTTLAEYRRVLKVSRAQQRLTEGLRVAAQPGRLLIVGLWVRPQDKGLIPRLMRWVPFFYGGSTPELKHSIVRSLEKHGFQAQIREVYAGDAELGVIIAQPILA